MKSYMRKAIILFAISVPILFVIAMLVVSGSLNTWYYGFALDNNGMLYVGKASKIDVYDNGEFINTVYQTNSSGYSFTIKDEKLYIADWSKVEELDLSGNLIDTIDDNNSKEWRNFHKQRNEFSTGNAKYVATNILGFYKITEYDSNGKSKIVYQVPIIDFILTTAIYALPLSIIIVGIRGYVLWRRWKKKGKRKVEK